MAEKISRLSFKISRKSFNIDKNMVTENCSENWYDTTMIEFSVDKIFSKLNGVNKMSCNSSITEKHRNEVATTVKQKTHNSTGKY